MVADEHAVQAARAQLAAEAAKAARNGRDGEHAAVIRGGGVVPTSLLAELIRNGDTISPLRTQPTR